MKKVLLSGVVVLLLSVMAVAPASAAQWRLPLGLTYVSGFRDILDLHKDNLRYEGYDTDSVGGVPIGISFRPYYEFDSGLGAGLDVGPVMVILGDTDFFNLPLNLNLRYALKTSESTAVYVRGGVSYCVASGEYVEDSKAGLMGAVGLEFMRNRKVGAGVEVGYDSSVIEFEDHSLSSGTREIKPIGFNVSVYVVF